MWCVKVRWWVCVVCGDEMIRVCVVWRRDDECVCVSVRVHGGTLSFSCSLHGYSTSVDTSFQSQSFLLILQKPPLPHPSRVTHQSISPLPCIILQIKTLLKYSMCLIVMKDSICLLIQSFFIFFYSNYREHVIDSLCNWIPNTTILFIYSVIYETMSNKVCLCAFIFGEGTPSFSSVVFSDSLAPFEASIRPGIVCSL